MNPEDPLAHHHRFMERALEAAREALADGEFPVGCVIVHENRVIATGSRKGSSAERVNETDHAEMVALKRLSDSGCTFEAGRTTLYSTMEPCLMCFGAILIHGIRQVVFAYEDVMGGATGCDLGRLPSLYREPPMAITGHVRRRESLILFQRYFADPANRYWHGSRLARYTLAQRL